MLPMRNYPCFLLTSPDAMPQKTGSRWGRGALLVLGRQFCVYFALDAAGIPARKLLDFVGLQAPRRAPFAQFDGVYLSQGDKVHVWVWPRDVVHVAQVQLGEAMGKWLVLPESLWSMRVGAGVVLQRCAVGVEALHFEAGKLQHAQWWPDKPDAVALEALGRDGKGQPVPLDSRSASERIQEGQRWVWTMHAIVLPGVVSPQSGVLAWLRTPLPWVVAGWLLMGFAGAYAGYTVNSSHHIAGTKLAAQAELDRLLGKDARAGSVGGTKAASNAVLAEELRWLSEVQQLTGGVHIDRLLTQLAKPLSERGLLLRELVVEREDIKLVLVSGYGGAVDLDDAVAALEAAGPWGSVELLDTANSMQIRFALKPLVVPSEGAVL